MTTQASIDFTNEVISSFDQRGAALGVFSGLPKAFDRVDHKLLCQKMESFGIRDVSLECSYTLYIKS